MNRSRGLRGYRSLSSFTPQKRASERLRKYKKTGRYIGTSVLAGIKHKKTPFSFRRKLSRLHTRYDIPYTHTHNNTRGIHKPTVLPIRRKRSAAFTYHSTISTHTPYNIPYTCTQRVYTHSHRKNNRKGSAKAQAYKHHIRHTPTHTRHTVSEGFAFTHPSQGTHKHTWSNKSHECMGFMGWSDRSRGPPEPRALGVVHTERPWFRRILPMQGDGKEGARVEHGRYHQWAQITEDRHKGWSNTGMIPNETPLPSPLSASRVWFSLLEKFQKQSETDRIRRKHQTMEEGDRDDDKPYTTEESGGTPSPKPTFIHARGTQLEHVAPVHFVKSSMSPAHLQRKQSWWNMVRHAHASKMLLSRRWTYFLKRRSHRRRMDVRLRPCQEDMSPSHRSPSDRYAAAPPTIWTRKPREAGVIYENGTIREKTSFVIPLKSFQVQSLQEHELRVVVRYDTVMTAGELTRHVGAHYGTNPDLYLVVNGTPLEDSDKVSNDYRQQILVKTRLRGGMRRSSRTPAVLDVTKELRILRQREPLQCMDHQQARITEGLRELRYKMWLQHHPLRQEIDRLLSATKGPISEDDLKNLHHLSTDCNTRPLLQRGLFCQDGCLYTGMGDP